MNFIQKLSDKLFDTKMKMFGVKGLLCDTEIEWYIKNEKLIDESKCTLDYENQLQPNSLDLRLGDSCIYLSNNMSFIDTQTSVRYDQNNTYNDTGRLILQPGEFVLCNTMEYFNVPNGMVGFVQGRSSMARIGLQTEQAGLVDAGFFGTITLELYNESKHPIILYKGMRVAQVHFIGCNKSRKIYSRSRNSKYNGQTEATGSRINTDNKNS